MDLYFNLYSNMISNMKQIPKTSFLVYFLILLALFSVFTWNVARANETIMSAARKYYYGTGAPQNMGRAFMLYRKAANDGNVNAMFIVGGMYMKGIGTPVNRSQAFRWLYKAAEEGKSSKESERILAEFFITGSNVPQNFKEALHWYKQAAESGDQEAQSELGFLYFSGRGNDRDFKKARYWFEKAARKGYSLAQYNMGILWYTGNGVEQVDLVESYTWFNLAAANGDPRGIAARKFLQTILSSEEIAKAQKHSAQIYRKITEQ